MTAVPYAIGDVLYCIHPGTYGDTLYLARLACLIGSVGAVAQSTHPISTGSIVVNFGVLGEWCLAISGPAAGRFRLATPAEEAAWRLGG